MHDGFANSQSYSWYVTGTGFPVLLISRSRKSSHPTPLQPQIVQRQMEVYVYAMAGKCYQGKGTLSVPVVSRRSHKCELNMLICWWKFDGSHGSVVAQARSYQFQQPSGNLREGDVWLWAPGARFCGKRSRRVDKQNGEFRLCEHARSGSQIMDKL